ncbi:MAG: ParB N-terminal domain-containing protein [Thermoplasmata archaeon]|nr:ParB N-terminal domain-containing protein [Thermoplasmata archaeon]
MRAPVFVLLEIGRLREHEEVLRADVERLVEEIRAAGRVDNPIWVDRTTGAILNGHHRFAALRALGARRVPAWEFDYADPRIRLDRWNPGPVISKAEVLRRSSERRPFPPKTTRHQLEVELPPRPTPLAVLLDPRPPEPQVPAARGRTTTRRSPGSS